MFLKIRITEKRQTFIFSSEKKTIILKLHGINQSSVFAIDSSCNNCFIIRVGDPMADFNFFKLECISAMLFILAPVRLHYVLKQRNVERNPNCVRKALKMWKVCAEIV